MEYGFLKGDECPLMFGKWKPLEFYFSTSDGNHQRYTFDFEEVTITYAPVSKNPDYSRDMFSIFAQVKMLISDYKPDQMFDPRVAETYLDAKKFIRERANIDVDKISNFHRKKKFYVDIGGDFPIFYSSSMREEDELLVKKTMQAHEIYLGLESMLKEKFGIVSESMKEKDFNDEHLDTKILNMGHGVSVEASTDDLKRVLRFPATAGHLRFAIASDETATKEKFDAVYQAVINYLLNQRDKLKKWCDEIPTIGGVIIDTMGSVTKWEIHLDQAESVKRLSHDLNLLTAPESFK